MFSEVSLNDVVDGIGMIGFALAGLLATEKYRVDPVGVFVAIFSTAFGGGIVRDIMLDLRPFYWMSHPQWIWLAFVMTIFAPPLIRKTREGWRNIVYIWADAIGLAFFAVGSTATAWSHNQGAFMSVLIGAATGVFGGKTAGAGRRYKPKGVFVPFLSLKTCGRPFLSASSGSGFSTASGAI